MTLIALVPLVPPLILAFVFRYVWMHRTAPGARSLLVLIAALIEWGIADALRVMPGVDLSIKMACYGLRYIGIAVVPVAWLTFALEYTGRQKWLTRRSIVGLLIVPLITSLIAVTNVGDLMNGPVTMVEVGPFVSPDASFGPWFWVHAAYSYVLILTGTLLILRAFWRSSDLYRRQAGALLLGAVIPWISNVLVLLDLNPIRPLDLTSMAFTVTAIIWVWALFRYRLLDIAPVARDVVFESMTDVVIVADAGQRVVDLNPAAQKEIGCSAAEAIGQLIERLLANWPDVIQHYRTSAEVQTEVVRPARDGVEQRYFDLRIAPITDRQQRLTGRLIVLRDITEGRLMDALSASEKQMRRRAVQLQTVAEVARAITSERNLAELLPLMTRLIGERFSFYHVAIFMLDQNGEYAVLQAASSEGGQQMLAQGHQLKVGQTGIVGYVAGSGLTRTVTDVSRDAEFVSNSYLPLTRSEMALPLKVREQVIGVLDVQSAQVTGFAEEDVTLLATLADQVATAIENARSFERVAALADENRRLLENSEKAVEELNALTRRLTAEGWEQYFTGPRGELVVEDVMPDLTTTGEGSASSHQAPGSIRLTTATRAQAMLTMPILLRGEPIGTIDLEPPESSQDWNEENVLIIKSVAERVGLALDNARLFEQTQIALSETEQLYNVGVRINTAATLEDLLHAAIAPSIATRANSAGIWLFELNEEEQPAQMEFVVSWTREGDPPLPLGTRFRVADYPSSELWLNETGQPNFIGDIARDERVDPRMRAVFQQLHIAATAFMPLTLGSRWVGIIIVSWREPHEFAAGEQRMYQSIASQVAVRIENRRLFEQVERRAAREARLNQIAQQLRQTTDIRSILQTATQELSQALDTSYAQAQLGQIASPVKPGNGSQNSEQA
jgi:PAS domain S-box-containing protein